MKKIPNPDPIEAISYPHLWEWDGQTAHHVIAVCRETGVELGYYEPDEAVPDDVVQNAYGYFVGGSLDGLEAW